MAAKVGIKDTLKAIDVIKSSKSGIHNTLNWREVQKLIRVHDKKNACGERTIREICEAHNITILDTPDSVPLATRMANLEERMDRVEKLAQAANF